MTKSTLADPTPRQCAQAAQTTPSDPIVTAHRYRGGLLIDDREQPRDAAECRRLAFARAQLLGHLFHDALIEVAELSVGLPPHSNTLTLMMSAAVFDLTPGCHEESAAELDAWLLALGITRPADTRALGARQCDIHGAAMEFLDERAELRQDVRDAAAKRSLI